MHNAIKRSDEIEVGAVFPITNWKWVHECRERLNKETNRTVLAVGETLGIGRSIGRGCGQCASAVDYAQINGEVADADVCAFFTDYEGGKFNNPNSRRVFLCTLLTSANPGGTAAPAGFRFFISHNAIAGFIADRERTEILFDKLNAIELKPARG